MKLNIERTTFEKDGKTQFRLHCSLDMTSEERTELDKYAIGNILEHPDMYIWNNLYSATGYTREAFTPAECDKALGQVRAICHTVINFALSAKPWAKNTTEDFPFIRQGIAR